jgi:colanic acid biosynthesis glycosyl transferase WcaI
VVEREFAAVAGAPAPRATRTTEAASRDAGH